MESGLPEKTANVLTKAVTKIELAKSEEWATKRDIAEMKVDLQRWVITVMFGTAILQAALLFKISGHI